MYVCVCVCLIYAVYAACASHSTWTGCLEWHGGLCPIETEQVDRQKTKKSRNGVSQLAALHLWRHISPVDFLSGGPFPWLEFPFPTCCAPGPFVSWAALYRLTMQSKEAFSLGRHWVPSQDPGSWITVLGTCCPYATVPVFSPHQAPKAVSFTYAVPFKGCKEVLEMESSSVSNLYLLKKIERLFMQKDKIPPLHTGKCWQVPMHAFFH